MLPRTRRHVGVCYCVISGTWMYLTHTVDVLSILIYLRIGCFCKRQECCILYILCLAGFLRLKS